MPDDLNNHDHIELLETALRRDVPPVEPWSSELQTRIVASIRAESDRLRRILTLRRFAVGGALAAGLLLAIALLVMSRPAVNSPEPIVNTEGIDENIFAFVKIPPAPVIVDDSIGPSKNSPPTLWCRKYDIWPGMLRRSVVRCWRRFRVMLWGMGGRGGGPDRSRNNWRGYLNCAEKPGL